MKEHEHIGFSAVTKVFFHSLKKKEILWYVQNYKPYDKAGAYAIQGAAQAFIPHLSGSHSGVMGLPLFETARLLRDFGIAA